MKGNPWPSSSHSSRSLESHWGGTKQKRWWCIKNCSHVFLQLTKLPKHAREPLSNAHWSLLKGKPTGLPLETGNTRRKKGRSVGVKRRSDIIKRRTKHACLREKESTRFPPTVLQTSRGRPHWLYAFLRFVCTVYFILFWVRMRQTDVALRFKDGASS